MMGKVTAAISIWKNGNILDLNPLNAWLGVDHYFGMLTSESHLLAKVLTKVGKLTFGNLLCFSELAHVFGFSF